MIINTEEIINNIVKNLKHGCPFCGECEFKISKYDINIQDTGNRSYSLIPIICENCGNTIFIHGNTIGLVDGDDNAI